MKHLVITLSLVLFTLTTGFSQFSNNNNGRPTTRPILGRWFVVSVNGFPFAGEAIFRNDGTALYIFGGQPEDLTYTVNGTTIILNAPSGTENYEILENRGNTLILERVNTGQVVVFRRGHGQGRSN